MVMKFYANLFNSYALFQNIIFPTFYVQFN